MRSSRVMARIRCWRLCHRVILRRHRRPREDSHGFARVVTRRCAMLPRPRLGRGEGGPWIMLTRRDLLRTTAALGAASILRPALRDAEAKRLRGGSILDL